jgi:DNA-binding NarL/FixJ family response regulator
MSLQPQERTKTESGPEESFCGKPEIALLNDKQWSYVQKLYRMSPRELQVAKLVCKGFTNGDIARRLRVRPGTVKTHLRSIFGKTRVRNKISMLLRCVENVRQLSDDFGRTAPLAAKAGRNPSGDGENTDDA